MRGLFRFSTLSSKNRIATHRLFNIRFCYLSIIADKKIKSVPETN